MHIIDCVIYHFGYNAGIRIHFPYSAFLVGYQQVTSSSNGHITGLFKIKTLYYEKRLVPFEKLGRNISSVFIGMAFAAGWTPCVGPILASILIYAGSMETITMGILLLAAYSLGLAVPFILTAYAIGSFSGYFRRISGHLNTISIISGVLLILMGILIFTNRIAALSRYFDFFNF